MTLVDARTTSPAVEASTASPSSSPRSDGRRPAEGARRPRYPRNRRTMTPAPRRTHQAAPPREDVLAAVMAAVAERGLDGLTMAGLGRAVGMSSGHLLYYFRTKDELLLRTLEWSETASAPSAAPCSPGRKASGSGWRGTSGSTCPPDTAIRTGRSGWRSGPLPERRRRGPRPAGRHRGRLAPRPGGAAGGGRLARGVPAGGRRPVRRPAAGAAGRVQRPRDGRDPGDGAGAGARTAAEFLDETLEPGPRPGDASGVTTAS
ncbi:TetR family transcriptional regulator [Streptomyces californicus]